MKRSTLSALFVAKPTVENGAPTIGMNPEPRTPSPPQPCVTGDVTSESCAGDVVHSCGSSKPYSRSSPDWFMQAACCGVAGAPLLFTAKRIVTTVPPGP